MILVRAWRSIVAALALSLLLLVLTAPPARAPQIELRIDPIRPVPTHVSRDREPRQSVYPRACFTTPVVEIGCVRNDR